jgi:ABC-type transport system substrate-binding protein
MRYDYREDMDPEIRSLCDEATTIPDPEERAEVYQEIQRLMNQRSPWIGIMSFAAHVAVRADVENFVYHPGYQVQLEFVDKK